MPRAKLISLDEVEAVKEKARLIPRKNLVPQSKAIEILLPTILKLQEKGYTLKEIHKFFASNGLDFHMSKLKRAVGEPETTNEAANTEKVPEERKAPKEKTNAKDAPQPEPKESEKSAPAPDKNGTTHNADSAKEKREEKPAAPTTEKVGPISPSVAKSPVLHKERINLSCKKEDQELAKKLGAQWDNDKNLCYIPPLTDLRPFEKLLPKPLTSYGTQS